MQSAKIGNIDSFIKRMKQLEKNHKRKYLKYASDYEKLANGKITKELLDKHGYDEFSNESIEDFKKYILGQVEYNKEQADKFSLSIPYYKKLQIFKTSNDNCDFDPKTGLGHSYRWYTLTKVFKNKLVLNSYRYSNTTSRHISHIRHLFNELGLKFVELDAPSGLQDLDRSFNYIVRQLGNAMIKSKHSKSKNKWLINYYKKQLETLKNIGYKFSMREVEKTLKQMIIDDNEQRQENKKRGIELRKQRRILQKQIENTEAISLNTIK